MWIHPGSGGEYKNMPFSFYKNLAETWLKNKSSNLVTFCFGEADWKIFKTFEETKFLFSGRIKYVQPSSVEEYKSNLREGVFEFWGNDNLTYMPDTYGPELPTLWLNPEVKNIFDFQYDDIKVVDYKPLPAIKAKVAV